MLISASFAGFTYMLTVLATFVSSEFMVCENVLVLVLSQIPVHITTNPTNSIFNQSRHEQRIQVPSGVCVRSTYASPIKTPVRFKYRKLRRNQAAWSVSSENIRWQTDQGSGTCLFDSSGLRDDLGNFHACWVYCLLSVN